MKNKWENYDPFRPHTFPNASCVYCVQIDGVTVYVGSTTRFKARFYEHKIRHGYGKNIILPWCEMRDTSKITLKAKISNKYGDWAMLELRLIKKLKPYFNKMHKLKKRI